jgi:hypothetical protein
MPWIVLLYMLLTTSAHTGDPLDWSFQDLNIHRTETKKVLIVGIVLNIFRAKQDTQLRNAFRVSVTNFRINSPDAPFVLNYFFFYGKTEDRAFNFFDENKTHKDIFQGDFLENSNDGKMLALFQFASKMHGHFVIKVEADTSVRWSNLDRIAALDGSVYFGEVKEHIKHGLPRSSCTACKTKCRERRSSQHPHKKWPELCTYFMASPLYGISMDAARAIARCAWAENHRRGREDVMVADWLAHCAPPVRAVHINQGELHRHGNSRGPAGRIAFNIISERLRPYEPARPAVQRARKVVLVAIMSNAHTAERDRYVRDAFRDSIANFRRRAPDAPFELSYFFFFGRADGVDLTDENRTHGDILQGDFPENMNDGKSFELLNHTSRMRGDFVVKLDDDTTVRWGRLELVAALRHPVFFGSVLVIKRPEHFRLGVYGSSTECQCLPELPCTPGRLRPARCYYRMLGPLYGLSMDVVREVVACEYARQPRHEHEDIAVSQWLQRCRPHGPLYSAHLPEGLIHRHGNKLRLNGNDTRRVEFNILTERLTEPRFDRAWHEHVAGGGGAFPAPVD